MELKSIPVLSVVVMLLVDVVLGQDEKIGQWSDWSEWSECSISCGSGTTKRIRYWQQPPGEKKFENPFTMTENRSCNDGRCPVDGRWTTWGRWDPCTEACGGGTTKRKRRCRPPVNGGLDCEGEDFEEDECNRTPCPPPPPRFNMSACTEKEHFMCTSRRMCVPIKKFCDNTVQCDDGSDEKRCYAVDKEGSVKYSHIKDTAPPPRFNMSACTEKEHFMCTSRRMCVPIKKLCDNTVQCDDGSDEKRCYAVDKEGSVKYSHIKDTGSTNAVSLSAIIGLVAMAIIKHVVG